MRDLRMVIAVAALAQHQLPLLRPPEPIRAWSTWLHLRERPRIRRHWTIARGIRIQQVTGNESWVAVGWLGTGDVSYALPAITWVDPATNLGPWASGSTIYATGVHLTPGLNYRFNLIDTDGDGHLTGEVNYGGKWNTIGTAGTLVMGHFKVG